MPGIAKKIETDRAPKAIGPYSQGVRLPMRQEMVFVSGQLPIDPASGKLLKGDIRSQTQQAINNLEAILIKAKSNLRCVVRVDLFLKNLKQDFKAVNEEYARRFVGFPEPVRQTVQVQGLPLGSQIEISCIAYTDEEE